MVKRASSNRFSSQSNNRYKRYRRHIRNPSPEKESSLHLLKILLFVPFQIWVGEGVIGVGFY